MAKYIRISDDGFVWRVPVDIIASHRATYYADKDEDTTYQEEFEYVVDNDYEAIDWMQNNMDWEDYRDGAELIESAVKSEPSPDAEYEIVEV